MNKTAEKETIILPDDPQTAELRTVTGWVSRRNHFFGKDEKRARLDGCTHLKCECGEVYPFGSYCKECFDTNLQRRYQSLRFSDWDGTTPVAIYGEDQFFFDSDDIETYLEENDLEPGDLMLVKCYPVFPRKVEPDYWEDQLPEDGDIPKELYKKLEELNAFIATMKPLCWMAGNIRTAYKSNPL